MIQKKFGNTDVQDVMLLWYVNILTWAAIMHRIDFNIKHGTDSNNMCPTPCSGTCSNKLHGTCSNKLHGTCSNKLHGTCSNPDIAPSLSTKRHFMKWRWPFREKWWKSLTPSLFVWLVLWEVDCSIWLFHEKWMSHFIIPREVDVSLYGSMRNGCLICDSAISRHTMLIVWTFVLKWH